MRNNYNILRENEIYLSTCFKLHSIDTDTDSCKLSHAIIYFFDQCSSSERESGFTALGHSAVCVLWSETDIATHSRQDKIFACSMLSSIEVFTAGKLDYLDTYLVEVT